MKIAIRGHDVCSNGDIDTISKGLNEVGIDALQLVAYKSYGDIEYTPGAMNAQKAMEVGKGLKENNISVDLIGAYFNPVHSNKDKVKNGIEIFKEYLAYGKYIGCSVVGSETGSYNDDKWTYHPQNRTEQARKIVVETFSVLCDEANKHDACVAIEGAAGHVLYDVKTVKKAFDEIGKDNLKIIFDLYNMLDESNSEDYLNILDEALLTFGDKIHCFHIKDCHINSGEKPVQCPVGKGDFNYDVILKKIKEHNENAVLIFEGTTGGDIKPAVDFIKETWKRL